MNKVTGILTLLIIALVRFPEARAEISNKLEDRDGLTASESSFSLKGTSARNRQGKRFSIVAEPLGVGPGPGLETSQALTFGYFIDSDSLISIEAAGGKGNDNIHWFYGTNIDVESNSVGANFKKFVVNTFYVRAGGQWVDVKVKGSYHDLFSPDASGLIEGQLFSLDIAIGNQWQWNNFTLGCDWIGVTKPIFSKINTDQVSGDLAYGRFEQDNEKSRLFKDASIEGLRFYLGASF